MYYYLYWDASAEDDPSRTKLYRATYESLEDAKSQAEADIEHGKRVVCIEKSKELLGGASAANIQRGESVWTP